MNIRKKLGNFLAWIMRDADDVIFNNVTHDGHERRLATAEENIERLSASTQAYIELSNRLNKLEKKNAAKKKP